MKLKSTSVERHYFELSGETRNSLKQSSVIANSKCLKTNPRKMVLSLKQEDLLDLITALVKLNYFFSSTIAMQCTFHTTDYYTHHIT